MKKFIVALLLAFLTSTSLVWASFETPTSPLPIAQSSEFSNYDIQVHNRDNINQFEQFSAQHGIDCAGPPATHMITNFSDAVFVCNGHVMTSINSNGYGIGVITPNKLAQCSSGSCFIQWSMSTERQSIRDWPDIWLTPWQDNLVLPISDFIDVDLQGPPKQGIHINLNNSQNAWLVSTILNYQETVYNTPYNTPSIQTGIDENTNQAAVRQTFKLTLNPNYLKLERLASSTAAQLTFFEGAINSFPTSNLVVQFAHHSYDPTKDGAGVPATWHWSDFIISPSTDFTIINSTRLIGNSGGTVMTQAVPANSYLRFSATCKVKINGVLAEKQRFIGHPEHASSYFVPVPEGSQNFAITFVADSWYQNGIGVGCYAADFAVWSTNTISNATSTPQTATATVTPTKTNTPTVTATYRCQRRNANGSWTTVWTKSGGGVCP